MFVDFDNVYTGLLALDPAAAKRFAEDPKHWTEALADGGAGEDSRRLIDCPSLTQRHNAGADSYGRVPETAARPGHSEVENHGSLTSGP